MIFTFIVLELWDFIRLGVRVLALNATFNNISVISCLSVLLVEETGVPGENHLPNKLYHIMLYEYTSPELFELTTLVVMGTDCIAAPLSDEI